MITAAVTYLLQASELPMYVEKVDEEKGQIVLEIQRHNPGSWSNALLESSSSCAIRLEHSSPSGHACKANTF